MGGGDVMNESAVRIVAILVGAILLSLGIVYDQGWGTAAGFLIAIIPFMDCD